MKGKISRKFDLRAHHFWKGKYETKRIEQSLFFAVTPIKSLIHKLVIDKWQPKGKYWKAWQMNGTKWLNTIHYISIKETQPLLPLHLLQSSADSEVLGTFEEGQEDGHVQFSVLLLAYSEHGQQVRHPDDVLNLAERNIRGLILYYIEGL